MSTKYSLLQVEALNYQNENAQLRLELQELNSINESIISSSLEGTLIINKELKILYANKEADKITGKALSNSLGLELTSIMLLDSEVSVKLIDKLSSGCKAERFEFAVVVDGNTKFLLASVTTLPDYRGQRALLLQILDITSIKEAERQTKMLNQELEKRVTRRTQELDIALNELRQEIVERKNTEIQLKNIHIELKEALKDEQDLNELKTRFISMISHEYRTPLTVVLTSSYLLEQYYDGTEFERFNYFLMKIRNSVSSMTQLLEDVLTIDGNGDAVSMVDPKELPLKLLLKDLFEETRQLDGGVHTFRLEDNSDDDKHIVYTDEKLIRQVFSNILINACRYSPESRFIDVSISSKEEDLKTVTIRDYGIGIEEKELNKIFSSFYRGANAVGVAGTGLGLAIAKRSISALGGSIGVESSLGKGSVFTIRVPLVSKKSSAMIDSTGILTKEIESKK
ncbi:MAG: hypothetical protein Kapaf2KO_00660 [Candidatus Kapaibacteriales bacterium]